MITALTFATVFAAVFALALWRYPVCGLFLYLMAFYLHPPSAWWGYLLPDLRWSLQAAAVAVLAAYLHRRQRKEGWRPWATTVPGLLLIVFVLWMWFQNLWALDGADHMQASVQYTKYIIAFYLFYRLADTPQKLMDVLLAHAAGCMYLGYLCYMVGRSGDGRLDGVGGPGIDDANTLAMMMATGFVVAGTLFFSLTGWRRVFCVLSIPLMLNGLVLAGSRGAFLSLVAGCAVVFILRPPGRIWLFGLAGLLGVALMIRVVDQSFIDRMFTIRSAVQADGEIDSSAESRMVLIEAQAKMFAGHPLGAGHKGTAALSPRYLDERWLTRAGEGEAQRSSHNTFMTVLVEQGVPGLLLFLWMVFWGFAQLVSIRMLRKQGAPPQLLSAAAACCAALTVVLVAGNFTDYLMAEVQIWMLALLASAMEQMRQWQVKAPAKAVRLPATLRPSTGAR